jgi:uncharacterized protein (TIGR02145 family)
MISDIGTFTDPRDGKIYKTVKIGNQIWMAENLNFKINNSWCYKNRRKNGKIYGRLYTWGAALNACPSGWHIPAGDEWKELIDFLGGNEVAGSKMKAKGTIENGDGLWKSPNNGATNESGFSALPGGKRSYNGSYEDIGIISYFWSPTEKDINTALGYFLHFNITNIQPMTGILAIKNDARSVRCLMN